MSVTVQELEQLLRYLAATEKWERVVSACAQAPQSTDLHAERDKAKAAILAVEKQAGEVQPGDARCCTRQGRLHHPAYSAKGCRWYGVAFDDGSISYPVEGTPFYIDISPRRTSFKVLESHATAWGTSYQHGKRGSLKAALALVATLTPSTPADIVARVKETTPLDHDRLDRMAYLAEPGRRLWVTPTYRAHGYDGLGQGATATGLHASMLEMMFGSPLSVWTVAFTRDNGEAGTLSPIALSTVEEARGLWWVLSHDGHNLVTGGHRDRGRMEKLAESYPGSIVRQGCMFIREDGSVFTTLVSLADHLDGT